MLRAVHGRGRRHVGGVGRRARGVWGSAACGRRRRRGLDANRRRVAAAAAAGGISSLIGSRPRPPCPYTLCHPSCHAVPPTPHARTTCPPSKERDAFGGWKRTATATMTTRVRRAASGGAPRPGRHGEATYRVQRTVSGGGGRPRQRDKRCGGESRWQLHAVLAAPQRTLIFCVFNSSSPQDFSDEKTHTMHHRLLLARCPW